MTKHSQNSEKNQHLRPGTLSSYEVALKRWADLRGSAGDLNNRSSPWYTFEVDLDHELTYLAGLLEKVSQKSTMIDYRRIASTELADLEELVRRLEQLSAPPARKQVYSGLITATQELVRAIGAIPVPEQGHLGFQEAAKKEFGFLEKEYEFRINDTSPIWVAYTSANMDLELRYSPNLPETTFRISPSIGESDGRKWFYIDDLLYATGQHAPPDYTRFDLGTKDGVESLLCEISSIVREHGGSFLRGHPSAIKLLAEKADERDRTRSEQLNRLFNGGGHSSSP